MTAAVEHSRSGAPRLAHGRVYLDWNATAPLSASARGAMIATLDLEGNPSSVHREGRAARAVIDAARDNVATLVGAVAGDVVFTSGATEANATVIAGPWDTIFAAPFEHDSVTANARASRARHVSLPVGKDGLADGVAFAKDVLGGSAPLGRALLSLQLANSETGVVQPVAAFAALARSHGIAVHCDAVQAAGRVPICMDALGVDFLTLSAHKIGGPKGAGALVVREGSPFVPLIRGGGHERGRRAGTENIAAIAGFGVAAAEARQALATIDRVRVLRDRLEEGVLRATPAAIIVGADSPRLANTSCIALAGQPAETLVIKFDLAGFAVSAGSACSSGKVGKSAVLAAMDLADDIARSAIRVSIGPTTTSADIDAFLTAWSSVTRRPAKAA